MALRKQTIQSLTEHTELSHQSTATSFAFPLESSDIGNILVVTLAIVVAKVVAGTSAVVVVVEVVVVVVVVVDVVAGP